MKRFTLLMLAFMVSFASQAQVIIEQPDDTPDGNGIVSTFFDDISAGAFSADDFELTAQQDIYYMRFYGFQGSGATDLTTIMSGFSLYIYSDAAGLPSSDPTQPGTGLLEIISLPPGDPALTYNAGTFTVDINTANGAPLTLAAGTYWVSAVVHYDPTAGSGQRWNWFASTQKHGADAVLIDPTDIFAGGFTSWTPLETVTGDAIFDALSYTFYGQTLSVIEENAPSQITLFPNPIVDILNIQAPTSLELKSATMFDLLGKQTQVSISENNTINMSQMAPGVYILKLETNQGTMTKKVIKQ